MASSKQSPSPLKQVPELSLHSFTNGNTTEQAQFIDQLFYGLKYFGFIILKDHPIEEKLLNKAYQLSEELFNLRLEQKEKYISQSGAGQRGYTAFGKEHAKDNPVGDLKEFWHVGQELGPQHKFAAQYPENIWPQEIPEFKNTFLKIYKALDDVGRTMLQALTQPLDVDTHYFDKMVTDGNSILRLLHYPPVPTDCDPRSIRAAAHEDINLITLLVSASASGLELLDREGKWLPIETSANNLIIDAGDMLARITNDVIPSTTHRVVNPENTNTSRYSMPYFMHPHPEAKLSCLPSCMKNQKPKYKDINAQDFLMQRLKEIGLS